MERILVTFRFVFILEAIVTELALILLFGFMDSAGQSCQCQRGKREGEWGGAEGPWERDGPTLTRPASKTFSVSSDNIRRCGRVRGCSVRWDVCVARCYHRGISVPRPPRA